MDAVTKDITERKETMEEDLLDLFKSNLKITDWNVPEADDQKAAEMIVEILQNKLNHIKEDVEAGKYKFY